MSLEKANPHKKEGIVLPPYKKEPIHPNKNSNTELAQSEGLAILYLILTDAVTISSKAQIIKAKQMSGIAAQERKENADMAGIDAEKIPSSINVWTHTPSHEVWKKVYSYPMGIHWRCLRNTHWVMTDVKGKTSLKSIQNEPQIKQAELFNQTRMGARGEIEDRLMVLQQKGQVSENYVGVISDQTAQSIGKGDKIMDTLMDLTYKALQRRAPQT